MSTMDIPDRLAKKIEQNSALHGAILQSLAEFKPWFDNSKTPFFPEYTDHNWSHVTQTMATASALIQEEAWPLVTSTDAALLVLAVVLHDCGMHLAEDGFLTLITDHANKYALQGWTEKPWPILWLDFLSDASRFDARKLQALFGDTEPAHRPPDDPKLWTSRDKLLIGEFLRGQHARLAHVVALHGVPGPGTPPLGLKGVPTDLADLAGLIARSHGFAIRACIPDLAKKFDLRE
jgi:molecular chaperone HtpG